MHVKTIKRAKTNKNMIKLNITTIREKNGMTNIV
jgi:hypothetical protein